MKQELATQFLLEDHLCPDIPVLKRKWYYAIEVEPGVWTNGQGFENLHLTREALRRIDVRGKACLDIGTMEAAVPILLHRRGAADIVAYDRLNFADRISLLKNKLGIEFDLVNGPLSNLTETLRERRGLERSLFDVVIFSGVLYHMFDILGGLLAARRNLKTGGIFLLETAALLSDEQSASLNANGRYMPGNNFWLPALGGLDTLLRMCRLKPLDATYLKIPSATKTREQLIRVCVPCLAVSSPPRLDSDRWLGEKQEKDFSEHIDWAFMASNAREPVTYDLSGRNPTQTPFGTADLYRTVRWSWQTRPTDPSLVRIGLGDHY